MCCLKFQGGALRFSRMFKFLYTSESLALLTVCDSRRRVDASKIYEKIA